MQEVGDLLFSLLVGQVYTHRDAIQTASDCDKRNQLSAELCSLTLVDEIS